MIHNRIKDDDVEIVQNQEQYWICIGGQLELCVRVGGSAVYNHIAPVQLKSGD